MPEVRAERGPQRTRTVMEALTAGSRLGKGAGKDERRDARASALADLSDAWAEDWRWKYNLDDRCRKFYHGEQWEIVDPLGTGNYVTNPPSRESNVRITANLVQPLCDQANSLLTGEPGYFGAVGAKSDRPDAAASRAAEAYMDHIRRYHGLESRYAETGRDGFIGGDSFVHVMWDESRGRMGPVGVGEDGEIEFGFEGDLQFDYPVSRQVRFDPGADHSQGGQGVFVMKELAFEVALKQFPRVAECTKSDVWGGADHKYDIREASRTTQLGTGFNTDDAVHKQTVWLQWFYCRATRELPRGYMAIFCDTVMLYEGENPVYPAEGEEQDLWPRINWPLITIIHEPRKNSPWGIGKVEPSIEIQKGLNGTASKMVTHIAKIASAKVETVNALDHQWSDQIGQILRVPPKYIGASRYINPPPMPAEYLHGLSWFREQIETIMGVNPATQGQAPSAHASGKMVQDLQRRDFGKLQSVKQRHDNAWAEVYLLALRYFRRYALLPRKMIVAGEDNTTAVRSLETTDLAGATDIIAFNTAGLPRDPVGRILMLERLTQAQMLNPADKVQSEKAWAFLGLQDWAGEVKKRSPHRTKAETENVRILSGDPLSPWSEDDDIQHLVALQELRCSEQFEVQVRQEVEQMGMSPTLQRFDEHYAFHQQNHARKMMAQQAPSPLPQPQAAPQQLPAPASQQPTYQDNAA